MKDCIKYDSTFDRLREDAELLAPYATYTRYPDDRFNIDREEVVKAIACAEKILKFVKTKIEPTQKTPQISIFE